MQHVPTCILKMTAQMCGPDAEFRIIWWFRRLHAVTAQSCLAGWWQWAWLSAKNETMAFRWCTKFVANLDPGRCSLGAKGLNVRRVEATPWFLIKPEMNGLGRYWVVSHGILQAITVLSQPDICTCSPEEVGHVWPFTNRSLIKLLIQALMKVFDENHYYFRTQHYWFSGGPLLANIPKWFLVLWNVN